VQWPLLAFAFWSRRAHPRFQRQTAPAKPTLKLQKERAQQLPFGGQGASAVLEALAAAGVTEALALDAASAGGATAGGALALGAAMAGGALAGDAAGAGDAAIMADGVDMALAWALASVQAGVMVAPMRPLLAAAIAAAAAIAPAAAGVFSAVFSGSVRLTVPRGGARRSKAGSHSEPFGHCKQRPEAVPIDAASG
jgi:hypothetical protein